MPDFEALIEELKSRSDYRDQVRAVAELPARPARYAQEDLPLSEAVRQALRAHGIDRLYSHQHEAIAAALAGEHVTVAAGTASGKTACFFVPIAEAIQQRPTARALLLYPTKALAQDQLRKLADFGAGEVFSAATYDGDTPRQRRPALRRSSHVILTNPDMLHVGILPYHSSWRDFFRELKYVVVDEMHTYAGVFGAHTANVLRRLRRVAAEYGAQPAFICCSATVGNPRQLAEALTGLPQQLVADDGAPRGRKLFVLWNPPLLSEATGRRRSANMEAAELMAWLVERDVRTLVFTLARSQTELIFRYAREHLERKGLGDAIMPYRGGYLPEQRRAIEKQLFDGELLGVVATSALELGIDVGSLDAVIMAGYPGRLSSLWQRAGRAGRRQGDSLAILVGLPHSGVDQYIMAHPEYVLDQENERVLVNPTNPYVLAGHLMCAAYENPVAPEESVLFGDEMEDLLEVLQQQRFVIKRQRWYWIDPDLYPAGLISLRSISGAGYDIFVRLPGGDERLLGTMDDSTALALIHPGAIYLHEGETYRVEELDLEERRALVVPADVDYYTTALSTSDVSVTERQIERAVGDVRCCLGTVKVTSQVIGYRMVRQVTEQELGIEELDLPPQSFETQALWIAVGPEEEALLDKANCDFMGSLHALEHATVALLPLFVLCDQRDLGGVSYPVHPDVGSGCLFVYDGYPGGVGIARSAFDRLGEVLAAVADMIQGCSCQDGCPSCVQNPYCGSGNEPLDKRGALLLARPLADRLAQYDGASAGSDKDTN